MLLPFKEFADFFSKNDVNIDENMYNLYNKYAEMLVEWNEKINLTAITSAEGITEKHFLDSVLLTKFAEIPPSAEVVDIGTGAGFPGIPLKILRGDLKLTLIDSLTKRVGFLQAVSDELKLDANCVHSRAEEASKMPVFREKFDFATARAVAALPVLCEYCLPYVKVGGVFAAMKGPSEDVKSAFSAISVLGGKVEKVVDYALPSGDARKLILVKKISQTSIKYPRNGGQISKKPL
ncbi:MAG: 16S rRNA (guanine(527)-N(7))-methyltransferase RsmG [Oscillospiraceae bacterium]